MKNMLHLYLSEIRNIFNFQGKTSRSEYWIFFALNLIFFIFGIVIFAILWNNEKIFGNLLGPFFFCFSLVSISISPLLLIAITCRRLNDVNQSKLWFIPAGYALFIFSFTFWPILPKLFSQLTDKVAFAHVYMLFLARFSALITFIFCTGPSVKSVKDRKGKI